MIHTVLKLISRQKEILWPHLAAADIHSCIPAIAKIAESALATKEDNDSAAGCL